MSRAARHLDADPLRPAKPWLLLAGDAPPAPRRFHAPVPWEVTATGEGWTTPFLVHVEAKSAPKALRAAKRQRPRCTPVSAVCKAPGRTTAGALLASLPPGTDYRTKVAGQSWIVITFDDGAVSVAGSGNVLGAVLPAYVAADLRTVGAAARFAVGAGDRIRVIGRVADVLAHGVALSAPARYPTADVSHASAGGHPDGRSGYACVTDPHGRVMRVRQSHGSPETGPETSEDRTAFGAAERFVSIVGPAGAVWAIDRARARAGA